MRAIAVRLKDTPEILCREPATTCGFRRNLGCPRGVKYRVAETLKEILSGPQPTANVPPEVFARVVRTLMDQGDAHNEAPERPKALEGLNRLRCFALAVLASPFKSKLRLEAENAVLRHQLIIFRRNMRSATADEQRSLVLYPAVSLHFPAILKVLTIIQPETLVRWHRAGFSPLLAVEIAPTGRATADRKGAARADPGR